MIRREDTERAVEILTRYQSTLRSPEEQELKASIGKVSHIFQSELFQALLGEKSQTEGLVQPLHPWARRECHGKGHVPPRLGPTACPSGHSRERSSPASSTADADIHEFYDFTLRSAPLPSPSLEAHHGTARQQHEASEPSSAVTPRDPQNPPEDSSWDHEQRLPKGTGDSAPVTPPRLVRVTARRTEAPASVCSLVLSSHSTLPQDFMREEGSDHRG